MSGPTTRSRHYSYLISVGFQQRSVKPLALLSCSKLVWAKALIKLPRSGVAFQNAPEIERRLDWIAACATREFDKQIEFSPQQRSEIRFRLGIIVGWVRQDAQRPSAKAVAGFLRSIGKSAKSLQMLSVFSRTGLVEVTAVQEAGIGILMEVLGAEEEFREPEKLREFLIHVSQDCETIADGCEKAARKLQQQRGGRGGAPRLAWYDDFTLLLLELCGQFHLSSSLGRNRIDSRPTGQLFRLAMVMEMLLPSDLRARAAETRHDRLEKSISRISKA